MSRHLAKPSLFFSTVRRAIFGGHLAQAEVDGLDTILKACGEADWRTSWTAYALATAYHETNSTMQPVREAYWVSETWRKANLRYWPHYGRGYVQLTWPANYARADREISLGGTLVRNLDRALEPEIAAKVMVLGMAEGWFCGDDKGRHTLARHLPHEQGSLVEFTSARRIINGTDRAGKIASEAIDFQAALNAGGWTE